jgi:hypothetical protein
MNLPFQAVDVLSPANGPRSSSKMHDPADAAIGKCKVGRRMHSLFDLIGTKRENVLAAG